MRARPAPKTSLEMDEIFATTGLGMDAITGVGADELAAAGMSIDEGEDSGLAVLDDDSEPSMGDMLGAETDLAEGEDILSGLGGDK